jgi:hypothetical protein
MHCNTTCKLAYAYINHAYTKPKAYIYSGEQADNQKDLYLHAKTYAHTLVHDLTYVEERKGSENSLIVYRGIYNSKSKVFARPLQESYSSLLFCGS